MNTLVLEPPPPTSINDAIGSFANIVRSHAKSQPMTLDELSTKIVAVRDAVPHAFDPVRIKRALEERAKVIGTLLEQYIVGKFTQKMPLIDPALFDLKRHLVIETYKNGDKCHFKLIGDYRVPPDPDKLEHEKWLGQYPYTLPLFAYTKMLDCAKTKLGTVQCIYQGRSYSGDFRQECHPVDFHVTLPGIVGSNLRAAYSEALGYYHSVVAELYRDPLVNEAFLTHKHEPPEIGAIWIPTTKALSTIITTAEAIITPPVRPDPAMIIKFGGNSLLVCMWTVDEEEPFEQYIREFSTEHTVVKK